MFAKLIESKAFRTSGANWQKKLSVRQVQS
jgi:hypothetical protein